MRDKDIDRSRQFGTEPLTGPTRKAREEQWRHDIALNFDGLLADPVAGGEAPLGDLTRRDLGDARVYVGGGEPQVLRMSRPNSDHGLLKVGTLLAGDGLVVQGDREARVSAGQMTIYDASRPYLLRLERSWRCAILTIRREALGLSPDHVARSLLRSYGIAHGAGMVLSHFLLTAACADTPGEPAARHLGDAASQLLLSTILDDVTPSIDGTDVVLVQVKDYIRRHLADSTLTRESVARAHAMSPRTLDRLFTRDEWSAAGWIRECRLEAAYAALEDKAYTNRSIGFIAASCGFSDPAHFSRAFRARYAMLPSQVRRDR